MPNELKLDRERVVKGLECCASDITDNLRCSSCPLFQTWDCMTKLYKYALALIRELSEENERLRIALDAWEDEAEEAKAENARIAEENEHLKAMIDTSSEVVDYAVDKIREARASMLAEARRLSFTAGDQQYISISELEKIAKGNAE